MLAHQLSFLSGSAMQNIYLCCILVVILNCVMHGFIMFCSYLINIFDQVSTISYIFVLHL